MSRVPVLVNGARGRMGSESVLAIRAEDDLELVGETDLGDDLADAIRSSGARVVVDFTLPASAHENTRTILEAGASPVVGTTGFRPEQIDDLVALAAKLRIGGLIAPNFAIGAVLLMRFARQAVRFLPDVEVIELHHDQKADAPSGTALHTIEGLRQGLAEAGLEARRGRKLDEHESLPGSRGGEQHGIRVHSVRLPGYVAHEEVLFGGPGQVLSIRHDSISRASFMPGVVLAVRKVPKLDRLLVGLEHLLDL